MPARTERFTESRSTGRHRGCCNRSRDETGVIRDRTPPFSAAHRVDPARVPQPLHGSHDLVQTNAEVPTESVSGKIREKEKRQRDQPSAQSLVNKGRTLLHIVEAC